MSQMDVETYKRDLKRLISEGNDLFNAMQHERAKTEFEKVVKAQLKDEAKAKAFIKSLPDFNSEYQKWYSEALECVRQILPSRLDDFVAYYKPLKPRKEATYETYTISDYLNGLSRHIGMTEIVNPDAGLTKFRQQLKIVESMEKKFKSSLFDIRTLVQASLFDNEIDAAEELLKRGFTRAAGAVCGVVLEGHLTEVCTQHGIKITKKQPTIADLNDALKNNSAIDTSTWRSIQLLGDIRNMCDHKKSQEPKPEQVQDLIDGSRKIIKTLM